MKTPLCQDISSAAKDINVLFNCNQNDCESDRSTAVKGYVEILASNAAKEKIIESARCLICSRPPHLPAPPKITKNNTTFFQISKFLYKTNIKKNVKKCYFFNFSFFEKKLGELNNFCKNRPIKFFKVIFFYSAQT